MRALLLVGTVVGALGIALPALADEPKGPSLSIEANGVSETPMNFVYEICGGGKANAGLFKVRLEDQCLNGGSIRSHAKSATTVGDLPTPIEGEVKGFFSTMHATLTKAQRVVLINPTLSGVGDKLVSANGVKVEPVTPKVFFAEKVRVTCRNLCVVLIQYKSRQGETEYTWFNNRETRKAVLEMELFPGERTEKISVWQEPPLVK